MVKAAARSATRIASALIPGGLRFVRHIRRDSGVIVMYHGVTANSLGVPNWCQVQQADFEQQIAFLSAEYSVIGLAELMKRLAEGMPLPERAVCITFDDGFRNVYQTAFPILRKYETPATVFLVTGLIGGDVPPWPELVYAMLAQSERGAVAFESEELPLTTDRERASAIDKILLHLKSIATEQKDLLLRDLLAQVAPRGILPLAELAMLNWEEVDEMNKSELMTFGSHTHTHPILARCSEEMQAKELHTSRSVLLEHCCSGDLFAYPNGRSSDYTAKTKQLLRSEGYGCGLTTVRGVNRRQVDLYELYRVGVGANMKFSEFEVNMLGF